MKVTRREFLQVSAAGAAAVIAPSAVAATPVLAEVAPVEAAVKAPTSLSFYFGTTEEWVRGGGMGTLPVERDLNNPDNAENIAKLKAEQIKPNVAPV